MNMNWDGLGEDDEDDHFFDPSGRTSLAAASDLCSSGSDDDFEDSRMSFVSTASSASFKASQSLSMAAYDMWLSEPGDIRERRKRLLQGMGLSSTKSMLRIASTKLAGAVSRKHGHHPSSSWVDDAPADSKPAPEVVRPEVSPEKESRTNEPCSSSPRHSHSQPPAVVLVRSRSDGDIGAFSARTKQRKEELIGPISKQRLTRTLSGVLICQHSSGTVRVSPGRSKNGLSFSLPKPNNDVLQSVVSESGFGSFFLIKNLDTGKEFIVKEYNEQGMWNKLSDVQTGKQMTMEEFEKSVGYSPAVKQLMRRQKVVNAQDSKKFNHDSYIAKSFKNSKKRGAAILKNIRGVASSRSLSSKDHQHEQPPSEDQQKGSTKAPSNWVKARQHGKSYKEFTALHVSQEIKAHEGSIWTIKFSVDARFLASGGEDKVIHVWEVQECDVMSTRTGDGLSPISGTLVHPMAGIVSDRPPLAEITPAPSEKKRKGKNGKKKGDSMPDYVDVPETVFALSDKPVCSFEGHQDEVLDLAWSKSQLLLSSSMDKTVRLWDLETKSCLKMFAHNDYVTCIQFNPVDENYFISGSLDAKVRIWSIPDRQVVDWIDAHEMVTAASYTPDGQVAVCVCVCHIFHNLNTGSGFHNTGSQISASFSPDGKHVISASEDSHVYIWKVAESKDGTRRSKITVQAHEHFQCKDVTAAITWPGATKYEPPIVEIHSKRHSKRLTAPTPNSPTQGDRPGGAGSRRHLPPLPKKSTGLERTDSIGDDDFAPSSRIDPGIGISDSFRSSSGSISYRDSPSISGSSPSQYSWSPSRSFFDNGGQTVQATAWGMVIVTASLRSIRPPPLSNSL